MTNRPLHIVTRNLFYSVKFGFPDDLVSLGKTLCAFCFFNPPSPGPLDSRVQSLPKPTNELLKEEYSMCQSGLAKA